MKDYTYTSGEHYPVEHLILETAPEHVEEFLEADHLVWTLGEAGCGLFDHIPFLSKEVWVNDHRPGEMHFVFVWESRESWRQVGSPQFQKELAARFEEQFPYPYRLVRCVEEEEHYGIHRYSLFERG